MIMASTVSNKVKFLLASKIIDFANDSFKIILMKSGFTFNTDTHHGYADVSANELGTAYGYTINTKTLSGVAVTEDDTDDRAEITWSSATWTASGGDIGPTPGAIVFDDTVTAGGVTVADPIIGYIDFGGDQTQVNGGTTTISGIAFYIA
jgi:hypothetical protein